MTLGRIVFFVILIAMYGCASPIKQVKDISIPFQRPYYSIMPPQGDGWGYIDQEQTGKFDLFYGKKLASPTHTLAAMVTEIHANINFHTPDEFLNFVKKSKELGGDPRRFKFSALDVNLDNKFGDYSIRYYSQAEDHSAANLNNNEFLILKYYGYIFIHPFIDNLLLDISYSERGTPNEVDPNFKNNAIKFIDGLALKKPN